MRRDTFEPDADGVHMDTDGNVLTTTFNDIHAVRAESNPSRKPSEYDWVEAMEKNPNI
jgi:hypothetical protein